jgi:hypothetical protein
MTPPLLDLHQTRGRGHSRELRKSTLAGGVQVLSGRTSQNEASSPSPRLKSVAHEILSAKNPTLHVGHDHRSATESAPTRVAPPLAARRNSSAPCTPGYEVAHRDHGFEICIPQQLAAFGSSQHELGAGEAACDPSRTPNRSRNPNRSGPNIRCAWEIRQPIFDSRGGLGTAPAASRQACPR